MTNDTLISHLRKRADQIGSLLTDPPQDAPDAQLMRKAADALARCADPAAELPAGLTPGLLRAAEALQPAIDYHRENYAARRVGFGIEERMAAALQSGQRTIRELAEQTKPSARRET